jgi:hypothetical protein
MDDDDEPPGGAGDDVSAVSQALGYGVVRQIAVTFMVDGGAAVLILETTTPTSCFASVAAATATPVARASSAMQEHATRTSSLRISPLS